MGGGVIRRTTGDTIRSPYQQRLLEALAEWLPWSQSVEVS